MKKLIAILLVVCTLAGFMVPSAGAAEVDELSILQKAVVQTALSYYYKGNAVQYDSYYLANGNRNRSGIMRQTNNREPEDSSIDNIHYTVCSAFPHDTYMSAFGKHVVDAKVQKQIEHLTHKFEEQMAGGVGLSEKQMQFAWGLEGITANYVAMGTAWLQSAKYHGVAGTAYANMSGAVNPGESVVGYWGPVRDQNDKILYATASGVDVNYGADGNFVKNDAGLVQAADGTFVEESSLAIRQRSGHFIDETADKLISTGNTSTSMTWTDFASKLQPGDIIAVYRVSATDETEDDGGHTMMFLGDLFGDGQDYILHSSGSKYNNNDGAVNFVDKDGNAAVGFDMLEVASNGPNGGHYSRNGSIYMNPMSTLFGEGKSYNPSEKLMKEICVLRPVNRMAETDFTPAAIFRLDHPAVTATKRASVKPYRDVKPGDEITYTVRLENHSVETSYQGLTALGGKSALTYGFVPQFMNPGASQTISLQETLPAGTSLKSVSGGGKADGNVITWENVTVAGGEMKELSYTVTVTGAAGSQVLSPLGKIYSSKSSGHLTTAELTHEVVAQQMPTDGMDAIKSSTLSPSTYGYRAGTDAAEDVYRALGYALELPEVAKLVDAITDNVVQSREPSSNVARLDLILREEDEISDPAEKALLQMMVPGYVGGKRLHTVDENNMRSNLNRLRMLDMSMLQPGDILVYANTTKEIKVAVDEAASKVYVYLGNGRFASYENGTFTVVDAPIYTFNIYYANNSVRYKDVVRTDVNFASDAGVNTVPNVKFQSDKYTSNRKYTHSAVLHQAFLQDFFVALRPSRVGLNAVGVPEAPSRKLAAFELVGEGGFTCRAMATTYNNATSGNSIIFHEDARHDNLPAGEVFNLDKALGIEIDMNGFAYYGNLEITGETVKNGTFYGNVTVKNGAVLENVSIHGVLTVDGNATVKNVEVAASTAPVVYVSGAPVIQDLSALTLNSLNWAPNAKLGTYEKMAGVRSLDGQSDPSVTGAYRGYAIGATPAARLVLANGAVRTFASFSDAWKAAVASDNNVITLLKDIDTSDYTEWCQWNYGTDSSKPATYQKVNYFFGNANSSSAAVHSVTLEFNGFDLTDNLATNGTFFFRTKLVTFKNSAEEPSYFRSNCTAVNCGYLDLINVHVEAAGTAIFQSSSGAADQHVLVSGGSISGGVGNQGSTVYGLNLQRGETTLRDGAVVYSSSAQAVAMTPKEGHTAVLNIEEATLASAVYCYNRYGVLTQDANCSVNLLDSKLAASRQAMSMGFKRSAEDAFANVYTKAGEVKIGDEVYKTLEDAFAAAEAGDKLEMQESITVEEALTVPADVELAIGDTTMTLAEGVTMTVAGKVTVGEEGKIEAEKTQIVLAETGDYMGITFPAGITETVHPDAELSETEVSVESAGTLKLSAEGVDLYDVNLGANVGRILAKQIAQVYTVAPMVRDGEVVFVGAQREISVKSVAEEKLEATDWNDEAQAAEGCSLVAMLNYGMEATKLLTGENVENTYLNTYKNQMSALTSQLTEVRKDNTLLKGTDLSVIYGATGVMEDELKIRFYFRVEEGKYNDFRVKVAYGDTELMLTPAELEEAGGADGVKFYRYTVADLNQKDYAEAITVTAVECTTTTTGEGEEAVTTTTEKMLATVTDTIAAYAARLYSANGGQRAAMADAMILYGMAAKAMGK